MFDKKEKLVNCAKGSGFRGILLLKQKIVLTPRTTERFVGNFIYKFAMFFKTMRCFCLKSIQQNSVSQTR